MIENSMKKLLLGKERSAIEDALRMLAEDILKHYILKVGDTLISIAEIEMYYFHKDYYENNVTYKFDKDYYKTEQAFVHPSGFDVRLPLSTEDYYTRFLVRAAKVGLDSETTCGPLNVRKAIDQLGVNLNTATLQLIPQYVETTEKVYFATRKGIGDTATDADKEAMLSAAITNGGTLHIEGKEKYATCELKRRNIHNQEAADELSKEIIGYKVPGIKEFY